MGASSINCLVPVHGDDTSKKENVTIIVSAARAQVIVPELATHVWQDEFFNDSKHSIIAVFDHDAEHFNFVKRKVMNFLLVGAVVMYAAGILLSLLISALTGFLIIISGSGFISEIIKKCRSTLPHTAISAEGVVHFDEDRLGYLFPFADILSISIDVNGNMLFILAKNIHFYSDKRPSPFCLRCLGDKPSEYVMASPKDSLLLQKVVEKLRKDQLDMKSDSGDESLQVTYDNLEIL
ncbi:hypothetical protein MPSEU_000185400 [Mayamaea pseudoterrestris]|nr:hypothetical protein MPSEU_000185400 [Mayamaea pseudoterrestris]